jgi:hypothetical protein
VLGIYFVPLFYLWVKGLFGRAETKAPPAPATAPTAAGSQEAHP